MQKIKAKLIALIMTISCFALCLGFGIGAMVAPQTNNVAAQAEATYTITNLGGLGNSNDSVVYAYATNEAEKPVSRGWPALTFVEGTGTGFTWKGKSATLPVIKQAGQDFYIELGKTAVAGDYFTLDGQYHNETDNETIIFDECGLRYNGSSWESLKEIGALELHVNSSVGAARGWNDKLYLQRTLGKELYVQDWDQGLFSAQGSGDVTLDGVIKVDGNIATLGEMKSTSDPSLYITFGALEANQVLTISGTFYSSAHTVYYVIEETNFKWTGDGWVVIHDIGALELHANSSVGGASGAKNVLYLQRTLGRELPIQDWENGIFSTQGSDGAALDGVIKVDGNPVDLLEMKSTSDPSLYIKFGELEANQVITIGGTFYCANKLSYYTIEETNFKWTGSRWVVIHDIGALELHVNSSVGGASGWNNALYLQRTLGKELPIQDWGLGFTNTDCDGVIKVDGNPITLGDVKSTGDGLYITFGTLEANQVVTIGGNFYCANKFTYYAIEETNFKWTGSGWVVIHDIGTLELHPNSSVGGASGLNNVLYLKRTLGKELPIQDWGLGFTNADCDGVIKVDGNTVALGDMKSTGDGLYIVFDALKTNQILTISGNFYCANKSTYYAIEESSFKWTGSSWEKYVPVAEPTKYTITKLGGLGHSNASVVYAYVASGDTLVSRDWPALTFVEDSGEGFLWKGESATLTVIQQAGTDFYINLGRTAVAGDYFTLDGQYYNATDNEIIIFKNCSLKYNGSAWVEYKQEITLELGAVVSASGDNAGVYLEFNEKSLPIDSWAASDAFGFVSGYGVTLNETPVSTNNNVKSVGGKLYVGLSGVTDGSTFKIGGTFRCETATKIVEYVITNSVVKYKVSNWVVDTGVQKEESTLDLGQTIGGGNNKGGVYLEFNVKNLPIDSWADSDAFGFVSGYGITLNGAPVNMVNNIKSVGNKLYVGLSGVTVTVGSTFKIGGTFHCETATKIVDYVIEESTLQWNGKIWIKEYQDSELEAYDVVNLLNLNEGYGIELAGASDYASLTYSGSAPNGSLKFQFGYYTTNISKGAIAFRLRGENWSGVWLTLAGGNFDFRDFGSDGEEVATMSSGVVLKNNTNYVIEIGVINLKGSNQVLQYVMVDGAIVMYDVQERSFNNYHVSIYGDNAAAHITHPDYVPVIYNTADDYSFVEYAEKGQSYALTEGRTFNTFIGWANNNTLYKANQKVTIDKTVSFDLVDIQFYLEKGASIRLAGSADESGIRFTSVVNQATLNSLVGSYGITEIKFGTLIMPYDYLEVGQTPNLDEFEAGSKILKIPSTKWVTYDNGELKVEDGLISFRGAMQKVYTANYERLFAGRAYMEITVSGETWIVYTPFDKKDNVRSIRYIAQAFKHDTDATAKGGLSYDDIRDDANKVAIVEAYAAEDIIDLMNYAFYKNNILDRVAWYYPELKYENGSYDNEDNKDIAKKLKDAGITMVYLDGKYHLNLDTAENVEKTRQIINFFWDQGLYTIAFGSNGSDDCNIDYQTKKYPDFSDCPGFKGFLVWDEPKDASMAKLAEFAKNFEKLYAGTGVTFMANLLPSYATIFQTNSSSIWGNSTTLDVSKYKAYLQAYCDTVLSQVQGEKWLSMDSYPINTDQSLTDTFLFDLAMLKEYSLSAGATSHAVLQSSGWTDENSIKTRMPEEAELRMQAYTALALGIDSISWWSYSDKRNDNQSNPTDSTEYYTRFANVNNELAGISSVYSAFTWKGVIISSPKKTDYGQTGVNRTNEEYAAYNLLKNNLASKYQLSASGTKLLSSIATSQSRQNYLVGVMEDMNGNEGYVISNYNSFTEDRTKTLTFTFSKNVTEVIIYRGGVAETVQVSNKKLAIDLADGEGVIVLPSKLG